MVIDIIINAFVFVMTAFLTVRIFKKEGQWSWANGVRAFRFFTILSNVFCAIACLLMCFCADQTWAWTLKYIGTAAVAVTLLTVFFFLGPTQGYDKMLGGTDVFWHLIDPLLSILSFSIWERRGMSFGFALLGVLPVALYGVMYLYRIIYAPEERRWEDFYGFNGGGHWKISFTAMMIGAFLISMGLMGLQNI